MSLQPGSTSRTEVSVNLAAPSPEKYKQNVYQGNCEGGVNELLRSVGTTYQYTRIQKSSTAPLREPQTSGPRICDVSDCHRGASEDLGRLKCYAVSSAK